MAYQGRHTGEQVDAAISRVQDSADSWDEKQDKISGYQGQIVGFNALGQPVPQTAPSSVPNGGTTGQVLTKNSNVSQDFSWQDPTGGSSVLPPGGRTGQVLTKNSNADQDASWKDPQGGGQTAGVTEFNGRSGVVTPQTGDYTAAMVGAVPTDSPQLIPSGGTTGQALIKDSNTNYDATWQDIPEPEDVIKVPGGGTVEVPQSMGEGPYKFIYTEEEGGDEPAKNLPSGGLENQVLSKASNNDYDVRWVDPTSDNAIPSGGTTNQVLTKTSNEDYAVQWKNPPSAGLPAGFGEVTASVDGTIGTPSVNVSTSGPDTAKNISFAFSGIKGQPGKDGEDGEDGLSAGFGTITATVENNTGTPSVDVTATGDNTSKNIHFTFHNLKGDKGEDGGVTDEVISYINSCINAAISETWEASY